MYKRQLREYPTATDEQAILRHLGEKDGVTLRIYTRQVDVYKRQAGYTAVLRGGKTGGTGSGREPDTKDR